MSNTITIDHTLYNNATAYAKRHKTSLQHIVESYIIHLVTNDSKVTQKTSRHYYISPAVKALETKIKTSEGLSSDYKKEIGDYRANKFL